MANKNLFQSIRGALLPAATVRNDAGAPAYELSPKATLARLAATGCLTEDANRIRPKNSEVERLFSDNTKAKTVLGWQPEIVGIEGFRVGLEKTIDWFSKPENLAHYRPDEYTV